MKLPSRSRFCLFCFIFFKLPHVPPIEHSRISPYPSHLPAFPCNISFWVYSNLIFKAYYSEHPLVYYLDFITNILLYLCYLISTYPSIHQSKLQSPVILPLNTSHAYSLTRAQYLFTWPFIFLLQEILHRAKYANLKCAIYRILITAV